MKLLLIEDDIFFQKFYSAKLVEAGYDVETAIDGDDGLAKMTSAQPNLILLDMIMPKKDGFEVLQAMSQNVDLKKIPVIVFSTLGDDNDVKRAMELGAVDYINKSFHDIENFKAKITAHLSGAPVSAPKPPPVAAPQQNVVEQSPVTQTPVAQTPQRPQPVVQPQTPQPSSKPPVSLQSVPLKDDNSTGRA